MKNLKYLNKLNSNEHKKVKNRQELAEKFINFLDNVNDLEFLHGQKFEEIFSSEENKRKFINDLSSNDFQQLLSSFNGVLRGKKKEDWEMDGDDRPFRWSRFSYTSFTSR